MRLSIAVRDDANGDPVLRGVVGVIAGGGVCGY